VIEFTPTAMPTATPAPVVYEEVKKEDPINIPIGVSVFPIAALLGATLFLYDPRPAQLMKFAATVEQAAPDVDGLNTVISFVGGTLLSKKSDKEEGEK
jgi:hypothetical protein